MSMRSASTESLQALGYNRGSFLGGAHGAHHREWLHFCVHGEGLDLLVNFSGFSSTDASERYPRPIPRITVLARDHRGWRGAVETHAPDAGSLPGGIFGAWMPTGRAEIEGEEIALDVSAPRARITAELRLRPRTFASVTHNVTVEGSPPLNWMVCPRLTASGVVHVDGVRYELQDAPSYHDHNWGGFRWGADFRWEWGYVLPRASEIDNPWTIVAVRLTDRRRTALLEQGLLVWKGMELVRTFRSHQVSVRASGFLGRAPEVRIPAALRLLCPGSATDVPQRLELEGREGDDHLYVEFVPRSVAQIIVPDDTGPTVTRIHEVEAGARVHGRIEGVALEYAGGGFVEILGS